MSGITKPRTARMVVVIFTWPLAAGVPYAEKFDFYSATTHGSRQTKELRGAPFNMSASAIVDLTLINSNQKGNQRWGNVRAVELIKTIESLAMPDSAPNFPEAGRKAQYVKNAMA